MIRHRGSARHGAGSTQSGGGGTAVDLLALFSSVYPASGSQIWVDNALGNDSSPGTSANPKKTLQAAANIAVAGSKIQVRAGTYAGVSFAGRNGTQSNWIQMIADPGAKIQGAGQGTGVVNFSGSTFVAMYGFEIIGLNDQTLDGGNQYELGAYIDGTGHSCAVFNCHIHHFPGHAFAANGGDRFDVMYCRLHDLCHMNKYQGSAISGIGMPNNGTAWPDGYKNRIVGNVIDAVWVEEAAAQLVSPNYVTDGNGVIIDISSGFAGRTLIAQNLIVGCGGRAVHALSTDHVDCWLNTGLDCSQNLVGTWIGAFSITNSSDSHYGWNVGAAKPGSQRVGIFEQPGTSTWSDTVFLRGVGGTEANDPAVTAFNNVNKTSTGPTGYFNNYQPGVFKGSSITSVVGYRPTTGQVATFLPPANVRAAVGPWPDPLGYMRPSAGNWAYGAFEATTVSTPPPPSTLNDQFTQANGSAPGSQWGTPRTSAGGVVDIQSNQLRMSDGTLGQYLDYEYVPSTVVAGDIDLYCDVIVPAPGAADHFVHIGFRGSGIQDSSPTNGGKQSTGYFVEMGGGNYFALYRRENGVHTQLGNLVSHPFADGETVHIRVLAVGSQLKAKLWSGAAAEPVLWSITAADATYASGNIWVGHNGGFDTVSDSIRIDFITVVPGVAQGGPTNPSGQAPPSGNLPGWTLAFVEDFNTDTVVGSWGGSPGIAPAPYNVHFSCYDDGWMDTSSSIGENSTSRYMPSQVLSTSNSCLQWNLFNNGGGARSAAVRVGSDQQYGRVAMRFTSQAIDGFKTAWLWWPQSGVWPRDGEIDFPEGSLDGTINGFMHRQNATSGGDQDSCATGQTYTSWHTAVIEWDLNSCKFILDGTTYLNVTARVPNTPMHFVLQTESDLGNNQPPVGTNGFMWLDWIALYTKGP